MNVFEMVRINNVIETKANCEQAAAAATIE